MISEIVVYDEDGEEIGVIASEYDNMYDHTSLVAKEFGNDWYSCEVIVRGYNPNKPLNNRTNYGV